jgi:hypothetical protein
MIAVFAQVLTAQYAHPKLKSKERAVHSFAVIAPKIDASGPQSDRLRSEALAQKLDEIVTAALKAAGREAQPADMDEKQVAALNERFDGVSKKLDASPKDVGKGAFTLGPDAAKTAVDTLVFVRADAELDHEVSTSASPGSFSITTTPKNKVRSRFSLVDPKTGDVLYYFTAEGKGDNPRTWAALEKGVAAGLKNLPK